MWIKSKSLPVEKLFIREPSPIEKLLLDSEAALSCFL